MPSLFTTPAELTDSLLVRRKIFDTVGETSQSLLDQSTIQVVPSLMEKLMLTRNHRVRKKKKQKARSQALEAPSQFLGPMVQSRCQGYWELISEEDIRPGSREGAAMAACGGKVILLGGSAKQIYSDMWVLSGDFMHWMKAEVHSHEVIPRTGHSVVEFNQQLVVFAGETSSPRLAAHRECLNTVALLNPGIMDYRSASTSGHSVVMRRYHCAAEIVKHMFVHGGLTEKNQVLDDAAVLNLGTWKWRKVDTVGDGPGNRAFHAAVGVFQYARKVASERRAREFGIYVFGGLDSKGCSHNSLHIIHLNSRPYNWTTPVTSGAPPEPRFQHTLTYFPELCLLVVYGGRQDTKSASGYRCFGTVHLFHLDTFTWLTVNPGGAVPESRCAHAAAALGSRLIVFGGLHNSHYAGNDTFSLELNSDRVNELIERDKEREDRKEYMELIRLTSKLDKQEGALPRFRSRTSMLTYIKELRHNSNASQSLMSRLSLLIS